MANLPGTGPSTRAISGSTAGASLAGIFLISVIFFKIVEPFNRHIEYPKGNAEWVNTC